MPEVDETMLQCEIPPIADGPPLASYEWPTLDGGRIRPTAIAWACSRPFGECCGLECCYAENIFLFLLIM